MFPCCHVEARPSLTLCFALPRMQVIVDLSCRFALTCTVEIQSWGPTFEREFRLELWLKIWLEYKIRVGDSGEGIVLRFGAGPQSILQVRLWITLSSVGVEVRPWLGLLLGCALEWVESEVTRSLRAIVIQLKKLQRYFRNWQLNLKVELTCALNCWNSFNNSKFWSS